MMKTPVSSLQVTLCTLLIFFFQQNFSLFIIFFFVGLYRLIVFMFFPEFELSSLLHSLFYIVAFAIVILTLGMMLQNITQSLLFLLQYVLVSL